MPVSDWSDSGSSSSSSGGTKAAAKKAAVPGAKYTENQLVRLAGRLANTNKYNTYGGLSELTNTFKGYKPKDVERIAARANVPQLTREALVNNLRAESSKEQIPGEGFLGGGLGTVLWAANRPAQAVLGGIAEGPSGAARGFTGKEEYTPVRSFARAALGQSQREAARTEKGLGWAATPLNIGGAAVTDPLTYVTFGTSVVGRQGALRAAELSKVAAEDITMQGAKAFGKQGLKDLAKAQTEAALEGGASKLAANAGGRRLVRAVKGAPGGVKLRGKTVINFKPVSTKLAAGERYGKSGLSDIGNPVEAAVRSESAVRQAGRAGDTWAKGVADDLSSVFARSRGRKGLAADQAFANAKRAIQGNRISKKDYETIRNALDVGGAEVQLTVNQLRARDEIRKILDETIGAERAAGIQTPYLGQGSVKALEGEIEKRIDNPILNAIRKMQDPTIKDPMLVQAQTREAELARQYFPHVPLNPRQYEANYGQGGLFGARQPGFTSHRALQGPVSEINQKVDQGILGESARMQPDLAKALVHRQLGSAAAVNRQQTIDDLLALKGGDGAPVFLPRANARPGLVEVQVPGVGPGATPDTFMVHPELKADVERHFQNLANDASVEGLLKLVDGYNRMWKRLAVATPGFVSRNVQSNIYAAAFLPERGFRATLTDFGRAAKIQRAVEKGLADGDAFKFLNAADRTAAEAAYKEGALQGLFTPADIAIRTTVKSRVRDELAAGNLKEVAKRTARAANFLGPDNPVTKGLRNFNTMFEDNARLALFLHNRTSIGDQGAAKLVFKYLFDYNDLTPFEQNVLKRVSPFMTWTRKNVPLQLETLVKQPGRFSRVGQVISELNRQAGPIENGPVPGYLAEQSGFKFPGKLPFGMGNEGVVTPDLPYKSAYEFIAPLTKIVAAATKGEVDQRAIGQVLSNNTGGAAGLVTGMYEAASGNNLYTGQEYKPGQRVESVFGNIDPAVLNLANKVLPALSRITAIKPVSEKDKANQARKILSLLTGIGITPLNDSTRNSALYERLNALEKERQTITDTGGTVPGLTDLKGYKRKSKSSSSGGVTDWSK